MNNSNNNKQQQRQMTTTADKINQSINQMGGSDPKTSPENQDSITINNSISRDISVEEESQKWRK
jgi:hypothetical protein